MIKLRVSILEITKNKYNQSNRVERTCEKKERVDPTPSLIEIQMGEIRRNPRLRPRSGIRNFNLAYLFIFIQFFFSFFGCVLFCIYIFFSIEAVVNPKLHVVTIASTIYILG